jgi:hypothetical protein
MKPLRQLAVLCLLLLFQAGGARSVDDWRLDIRQWSLEVQRLVLSVREERQVMVRHIIDAELLLQRGLDLQSEGQAFRQQIFQDITPLSASSTRWSELHNLFQFTSANFEYLQTNTELLFLVRDQAVFESDGLPSQHFTTKMLIRSLWEQIIDLREQQPRLPELLRQY